jgi:hypothetical protein
LARSAPKESLEVLLLTAHADSSLNTGSAAVMATSGVGSAALCSCTIPRILGVPLPKAIAELRSAGRAGRPSPHEQLVSCASGFLCCGLRCIPGCAFSGTKVFRQVSQQCVAIGVGDDGAQALHFVEFVRPFLASHVLLGDAAGVVARGAGGLHFGLHGSGRKRFAWGAGRLRARQNDGCEQKDCRKNSLEQAGSLSQFSELDVFRVLWLHFFALVCEVDGVALLGGALPNARLSCTFPLPPWILKTVHHEYKSLFFRSVSTGNRLSSRSRP